jgi:hypothetical protein
MPRRFQVPGNPPGPARFENLFSLLSLDQSDPHPFRQAFDGEGDMLEDRVPVRLRVEPEDEDLVLVDTFIPLVRNRFFDGRSAGGESESPRTCDLPPGQGFQTGLERELALEARGQVFFEVINPIFSVAPAGRPFLRAGEDERLGKIPGVSEGDHGLGKLCPHLADVLYRSPRGELFHPGGFLGPKVEAEVEIKVKVEVEKGKKKDRKGKGCLLHALSLKGKGGGLWQGNIVYPNSFGTIQRESIRG